MRTYIIIGTGRSGTSFLAECLKKNGVNIGKNFYQGENPHHGYENQEFVDVNKELFIDTFGKWGLMSPDNEKINYKKFEDKYKKLIEENKDESWGVKEPRMTLFVDKFVDTLKDVDDDPFIYIALRKKKHIIKSAKKHNKEIKDEEIEKAIEIYKKSLINIINNFL